MTNPPESVVPDDLVVIDYTNHRGERGERLIMPLSIAFRPSRFYPATQWLLTAFCRDRMAWREFAMANIHGWRAVTADERERFHGKGE